MCVLSFPVYRHGTVLESSLDLLRDEALDIAALLKAYGEQFVTDLRVVIAAHKPDQGKFTNISRPPNDTGTSIRSEGPIIVDFPATIFTFGQFCIETRTCVTVCTGEKLSKCWSRYTLLSNSELHGVVSDDEVKRFFSAMEKLDEQINAQTIAFYQRTLRAAEQASELTPHFNIHIKSAVGDDENIETFYTDRFVEMEESSDDPKAVVFEAWDSMDPDLSSRRNADSLIRAPRTIGYSVPRIVEFEDNSEVSADILNSVYHLDYDEKRANFVGIGYDPDSELFSNMPRHTLSHLVSQKICTEYGELF